MPVNHFFVCESDLLQAAVNLSGLLLALLYGRKDRIMQFGLHAQITGSHLRIISGAGHDPFHSEPAVGLLDALNCFGRYGDFDRW
ncbi:MAG: hypothetical protein H7240_03200 [Glaciimonas sp.]|nr:hypothetical protein [Glaciimonas sp.]